MRFFLLLFVTKYITYFCNSLSKVWPSNLQEKSCQDSSEIMAKMSKKSVKKEILQSLLKSTQQVKRKINRERERGGAKGKWLNLEKKVYDDNGAVLLELLDSFINVNSLLVKALYSSFARYIYFKCWDFFPESNIIPPTSFCCTFKTIVVCGDWKIKWEILSKMKRHFLR